LSHEDGDGDGDEEDGDGDEDGVENGIEVEDVEVEVI
jgi:hypothetical protein